MSTFLAIAMMFLQQAAAGPEAEQKALQDALAEAGSSQVDYVRALERHLKKYPQSSQKAEIERAILKASIEQRDSRRIVLYGERVLKIDPSNVELLERVSRMLLISDSKESAEKSLGYSKRLEEVVKATPNPDASQRGAARFAEQRHIVIGKAYLYQSRATGNLGKIEEAEALSRKAFDSYPSAEAAREVARWLDKEGKSAESIQFLAEAFMIPDPSVDEQDRIKDRQRLGEWQKKAKGSEAGLGDVILAAFDRGLAHVTEYKNSLLKLDQNVTATSPMDFTISGVGGEKLALAKFKGKVVVFDFWATWCGPCRAQQPLYDQVKEKFKNNPDVVFLNINTDETRDAVKPFLDSMKWNKTTIYFEDGLSALLRVSSIPTTVVINRRGEIASRMNGYIAERFVEMLSERIEQSLEEN